MHRYILYILLFMILLILFLAFYSLLTDYAYDFDQYILKKNYIPPV